MNEVERERRIVELLGRAVELQGSARRRYLDGACLGDPALRSELDAMLEEDQGDTDAFLGMPAVANLGDGPALSASNSTRTRRLEGDASARSEVPERIGPYRIVGTLGQGGMGTVYLGEQREPVRRRAAVKMLDAVHDRRRLQRFAAEGQALARLHHPNVAALYEVGTTDQEQPYVAMEPVDGTAITLWCDQRQLPLRERIELFFGVCAGVRHAHEKGILHRDLKPANVLVTEVDGRPTAKVIDFGIARALGDPLHSGSGPMTLENQIIGSPAYMCPEIAAGEREVDTRSDVYSLGLLLYELLVGVAPFETRRVDLVTLLRRVAKDARPAPSKRYAELDLDQQHRIAADRSQSGPRQLSRRIRGDLDAIVTKALALDAEERYSSPADLATDLKRHLDLRPVMVRAATARYRTARFVHRQRAMVAVGSLLVIALVMGIVGTMREARRANLEARRATRALAQSEAVSEFLIGLFKVADPRQAQGEEITARELLDRGTEQLRDRFSDQPLSKARFMGTIGEIYTQLGWYERAESLLKVGLAIHEAELGEDHAQTAARVHELAELYRLMGRYESAEPLFRRALKARDTVTPEGGKRNIAGVDPLDLARTIRGLGRVLLEQGRYQDAEPLARRALTITEGALGGDHPEVATDLDRLGAVYFRQDRLEDAEPLRARALAIREQALEPDHPYVATSLNNLGALYSRQGRFDEAEAYWIRALAIREKVLGLGHPHVASSLTNLGGLYRDRGRLEEAEPLLRRALAIKRQTLDPNHPHVANSLIYLADLLQDQGRFDEAESLVRAAIPIRERVFGPEHAETLQLVASLAGNLRQQRRYSEAEPLYERALGALDPSTPPSDPSIAATARDYSLLLRALDRHAEAEALEDWLDPASQKRRDHP